jgi:predicted DNA-binding protein with PD1-like motif
MKKAKGSVKEILVLRLQRGDDIIESIKKACIEEGINNAVITSMIGSLDGASYFDPIINPKVKCGVSYGEPITLKRPVQLLSGHGEICRDENKELNVHIHATFADSSGNAYGGHISGLINRALNTVNVFIGVIDGVDMSFEMDEELGGPIFCPKQL